LKTIAITDVFSAEQITRLFQLKIHCDRNGFDLASRLKTWFNDPAMSEQLASKGFIPDFAAYAVAYALERSQPAIPRPTE